MKDTSLTTSTRVMDITSELAGMTTGALLEMENFMEKGLYYSATATSMRGVLFMANSMERANTHSMMDEH